MLQYLLMHHANASIDEAEEGDEETAGDSGWGGAAGWGDAPVAVAESPAAPAPIEALAPSAPVTGGWNGAAAGGWGGAPVAETPAPSAPVVSGWNDGQGW